MRKIFNERKFRMWFYSTSHRELLIRSIKDSKNSRNIDIFFRGVEYMELHNEMNNLIIEKPNEQDIAHVEKILKKPVNSKETTILLCNEGRFLVVAFKVYVLDNNLDAFELPEGSVQNTIRKSPKDYYFLR